MSFLISPYRFLPNKRFFAYKRFHVPQGLVFALVFEGVRALVHKGVRILFHKGLEIGLTLEGLRMIGTRFCAHFPQGSGNRTCP